jgi:NAD(P)-dependent dehydrogenase (short-subunit alcohol dehydrogenase family)
MILDLYTSVIICRYIYSYFINDCYSILGEKHIYSKPLSIFILFSLIGSSPSAATLDSEVKIIGRGLTHDVRIFYAQNFIKKGIRVNSIAPGSIWTPLNPSTFPEEKVFEFGENTPMGRAGQPYEIAGFVFLASDDASYITGQTLHINGGMIVNG